MKKYMMVTPETLNKLGKCFSSSEEVETFIFQMDDLANELVFSAEMRKRISLDSSAVVLLKQICIFTMFCREHMELMQQLIGNLECTEINEDEMRKFTEGEG